MPCPFPIFSQSDYLIQVVDINSNTEWQTVQIQISWLLKKPTDLDLHCLQRQGLSGFSRTRVNNTLTNNIVSFDQLGPGDVSKNVGGITNDAHPDYTPCKLCWLGWVYCFHVVHYILVSELGVSNKQCFLTFLVNHCCLCPDMLVQIFRMLDIYHLSCIMGKELS